ncbi:hypothetical protein A9Q87_07565 [Flavobacteriales bacterium 34_180_T64]|nr:hypothetical protein A9Q87_07565 [Flavobacteriales bacterium 34_180_T64]
MKKIVLVLIVFTALAFTKRANVNTTSVLINAESQLLINGKTNINSFKCEFNISQIKNPIPLNYEVINDKIVFTNTKLILDSYCFDCGSKGINQDFRALLKSNEYPQIQLRLKEIRKSKTNPLIVTALLELHIAGKSKSYYTPLSLDETDGICVSGLLKLNITDFDLKAPKKALGLIVVSDAIEIDFLMNFREGKF